MTATGGYLYDRQIVAGLSALGWQVRLRRLSDRFPFPDRAALKAVDRVLAAVPDHTLVVADGLGLGAMPAQAHAHARRLRLVGLVHHPLALETGLDADDARRLHESERHALSAARRVVVTSRATADALCAFGVARSRLGIVEPGTDRRPQAHGTSGETPCLLCVAALVPRKGHAILLDALHRLGDRPWRLVCAGSLERSPETVSALRRQLTALGLEGRVQLLGEVDDARLGRCYEGADLFVLPSFHEGYGMALAEALAYGLPVVSTRAGAVPDTVPADAGLLVPPGDSVALADALARLLDNAGLRQRLAVESRRAAAGLPGWTEAAARFADELGRVPDR